MKEVLHHHEVQCINFIGHNIGVTFKHSWPSSRSQRFSSEFSSRSLMILPFIFRAIIHSS